MLRISIKYWLNSRSNPRPSVSRMNSGETTVRDPSSPTTPHGDTAPTSSIQLPGSKHDRDRYPHGHVVLPILRWQKIHVCRDARGGFVECAMATALLELRLHYLPLFIVEEPHQYGAANAGIAQQRRVGAHEDALNLIGVLQFGFPRVLDEDRSRGEVARWPIPGRAAGSSAHWTRNLEMTF